MTATARYGFLIDQDTCIGCHACTVACKAEHDVPLGVNRTWLKYVEQGQYPNTQRLFSVMRCNHCDAAPCITICPTGALFRRSNGIVDFDTSSCIGCKSCMNACPYDAIYLDPQDHTAQKCNYCSHRVEVGLEPSCVIVCPTQSIVAGDLDDPASRLAQLVAGHDVQVRSPEQGTRPKLFYKGASPVSLDPTASRIPDDGMMWAETTAGHQRVDAGPTQPVARTVFTTAHPMPWTGRVTAYLVTKALAAGALMVGALLVFLGHADDQAAVGVLPAVLAGAFVAATAVLLVADLKQPRRFHYLLTRPNWQSWLTRGAVILAAFAVVAAVWFFGGVAGSGTVVTAMAVPGLLLGAATAGYTAFLFGQCEGRDLWQTPLLLPILLAQAAVAGAALFLLADVVMDVPGLTAVRWVLLAGVVAVGALTAAELRVAGNAHVELARRAMTGGRYAARFWGLGIVVGLVVPGLLAVVTLVGAAGGTALGVGAVAAVAAVVGLVGYEDAFVRAGQSVPLS